MEDESDDLMSFCSDLVTLRRTEAFPLNLLRDRRPGEWVLVKDVCQETGIGMMDVKPTLVATWLPDPSGNQEYAVIIFYDAETLQSFAAHHNRRRLSEDNPAASA